MPLAVVLVFVGLRLVALSAPAAKPLALGPGRLVVVGVTDRHQLSDGDRAVLSEHAADAAAGAVSIRARYLGDCAAAGWTTLGAGRRTAVAGLCTPPVHSQRVVDWPQRLAAARADHGDARLGTLAASVSGCVAAVGPGAALAAAKPDGTLAHYSSLPAFMAGGLRTSCPITVVDAGGDADAVVARLAATPGLTVVVTGVGPAAGTSDPGLQAIYALGARSGWLTSDSTRRFGIVNLTDLTRTLIDADPGRPASAAAAVDGAALRLAPQAVGPAAVDRHLSALAAISDLPPVGFGPFVAGAAAVLVMLFVLAGLGVARRHYIRARRALAVATMASAALLLAGAVPWSQSRYPAVTLALLMVGCVALLTALGLLASRRLEVPVASVAAGLTMSAFTVDAALGAVLQPGSLLNSRPVNGGRWYGFGNVTFSVYAAAALVLAGWLASRFRTAGHPRAAVLAFAAVGFGAVACEGWPTMGADFGGVLALTPGLLWALVRISGLRLTWRSMLAIVGLPLVVVAVFAWLDWLRGPGARSHLGNFVQRLIDGDAAQIVVRKGIASAQSFASPAGLAALVVGVALWVLIFRSLLPQVALVWSQARTVALAALATTVLGTVLNDGGVAVWTTFTGAMAITMASLWVDRPAAR